MGEGIWVALITGGFGIVALIVGDVLRRRSLKAVNGRVDGIEAALAEWQRIAREARADARAARRELRAVRAELDRAHGEVASLRQELAVVRAGGAAAVRDAGGGGVPDLEVGHGGDGVPGG